MDKIRGSKKEHKIEEKPKVEHVVVKKELKVSREAAELNQQLIDNFVSLQKVMTNLAVRLDSLSDNMAKLLQLFELSARSFMEKLPVADEEKDKEFLEKLNSLLEQNKVIARGLTLMEEKMKERIYGQKLEERQYSQNMMPSQMSQMSGPQPSQQEGFKRLPKI